MARKKREETPKREKTPLQTFCEFTEHATKASLALHELKFAYDRWMFAEDRHYHNDAFEHLLSAMIDILEKEIWAVSSLEYETIARRMKGEDEC